VLHETVAILSVRTAVIPVVSPDEQVSVEAVGEGIYSVRVQYGFMQEPNVPEALTQASAHGLPIDFNDVTYFLGRETILVTRQHGMAIWREKLFVLMTRNAVRATAFFRLPPERVVELGVQVEM
jgi:KUP system potassium uptake protein